MRRSLFGAVLITTIMFFGLSAFSYADVINGDFSNGLVDWTTAGDANSISGAAVLGDSVYPYSSLYQGVALIPGTYSLDFDFENSLSSTISLDDDFTFPDSFYATLYFSDDLSAFDLSNSGNPGFLLFGLDTNGPIDNIGTIGPSNQVQGWLHFNATFTNSNAYAIPTFELFDGNYAAGDSTVSIDNVSITPAPVPEPGTLISVALGLAGLILAGKKKLLA
jgi:hypothetical protein